MEESSQDSASKYQIKELRYSLKEMEQELANARTAFKMKAKLVDTSEIQTMFVRRKKKKSSS